MYFAICLVYKMKKNLTFWVDLWSQKVMWLHNGMSDFSQTWCQNICKTSPKKILKRRGLACAAKFVEEGLWGPPPPFPVQLGFIKRLVIKYLLKEILSY